MSFLDPNIPPGSIPVVAHILLRIYNLLPIESGKPVFDVEDDEVFLNARKSLLNIAHSDRFNDILKYSIMILNKLNEIDDYLVLKQRNISSLSSTLIILRLLADLTKANWDYKEPSPRKNSAGSNTSSSSGTSSIGVGYASNSIDYHTVQPSKLDPKIATLSIQLISRLKSTNALTQELALINGRVVSQYNLYDDLTTKPYIDQIDSNCGAILRFLSAANPADFFNFTVSKLNVLKHNVSNDNEFAPYLELFSSIYLNETFLLEYLKHLRVIISTIKKSAYRQLVLSFFLKAISIWIHSRPHEYLNAAKVDSNVSMEADSLFDEILSSSENTKAATQPGLRQFKTSYKFLAFLLTLYPKTLEQYASTETRSKTTALKKLTPFSTTNKKLKALTNSIKTLEQQSTKDSSENTAVLESLEFVILIATVAGSIFKYDPENIVVKFSLDHYNIVSRALVPISSSKSSPLLHNLSSTETQLLNDLRLSYYSNICVLNSKELLPQLIKILNDENSTLEILNIATSILRVFTSVPAFGFNNSQSLIVSLLPALRRVMVKMSTSVKNSSTIGLTYDDLDDLESLQKSNSTVSTNNDFPQSQYKSLIMDNTPKHSQISVDTASRNLSSPSSVTSAATPKADKLRESTKNLFRHHHSTATTPTIQSIHQQQQFYSSDDVRSIESKDASVRLAIYSREILVNAFGIFKKFPQLYLASFSETSADEKVKWLADHASELLDPLIISLYDSNFKLTQAAGGFLHSVFTLNNIPDDLDICTSVFVGSGMFAYVLAKSALDDYSSDSRRKDIFEHFIRVLESRITLHSVLAHHTYFNDIKVAENYHHSKIASYVEEILVFSLCTSDHETYSLIKRGIRAHEKELSLKREENGVDLDYNKEFFMAVSNDKSYSTGIVALQKNIRKLFLKISTTTPAIRNVWNRIYRKWYVFANSDYSELSQAELHDFRNFAGFLASTSGIFVGIEADALVSDEFTPKVETFFSQQLSMLREDSLVTRENAKEILASETNPKAYPVLVRLLKPKIKDFLTRKNSLDSKDLITAEHIIVMLKAILDKGDEYSLFVVSVDIVHCADMLGELIDSLAKDSTGLKLRVRCSLLFYKLELHRDTLVIKAAYKMRNKFLRYVFNWFEQAVAFNCDCDDHDHHDHSSIYRSKDLEYLYVDLSLESARALSLILEALKLESPQALNEEELKFSRARIFNIYFSTFLKALERFTDTTKFNVAMKHKINMVSDFIVLSLTNLLSSNVEVGLPYALPIGYHTNLKIRKSFLNVFVTIIQSYKEDAVLSDEYKRQAVIGLVKLLLTQPGILSAIGRSCPPGDAPALASFALSLANRLNQSAELVSYLVDEEILNGNNYADILRRNSFASRSLSAFGRTIGGEYLLSTLKPLLTEIRDSEADLEVEKIDINDPNAQQNLNNFMHYLKKLVNVIINSSDKMPLEFRKVCNTISNSVQKKFPDYRLIAVGSFIFLRYFCPAIVSPDTEKIVDIPNRSTQRKFLLLAKVLQNMVNGSIGTLRWPILKSREHELAELNDKLLAFLDKASTLEKPVTFEMGDIKVIDETDYNYFHSFAYDNWDTIRVERLKHTTGLEGVKISIYLAHRYNTFLTMAGQPSANFGYQIPPSITPESNGQLYEFMSKHSSKNLGPIIESGFIRQDITQDGTHLYVFTYRDFIKLKDIDVELGLYRMFQIASKVWDHKFNFVVDCTGADASDSIPRESFALFSSLAPEQMFENCIGIYYYNVSSSFYPFFLSSMKKGYSIISHVNATYNFCSGLDDKKTVSNLGLSKESIKCYNDVRVKFGDAALYQQEQGRFVPIIIKIGNEYIQICQTTPQRLKVKGEIKEIFLHDIFLLSDVEDVRTSDTTSVPNEITITLKNGKMFIVSSNKYLEIMRLLYFSSNRALNSSSDKLFDSGKPMSRLLGKIFNVIFLSLTSSSYEIRSIAYNLLVSATSFWEVDLGKDLCMFHEASFPRDNNSFVISASEKLAQQKPEITTEFISAFFKTYTESASARQRLSAIMYISPWVNNIYEHVFKSEDENGPDYVKEIIRNFLKVTTLEPLFLSAFNISIWTKFCLEDGISAILVDEIVLSAIDREAEGSDWRSIIALLTSSPTVEVCAIVIKRLRDISNIPFPDDKGEYSIASHSNWTEITVLVQICVSLFFDNILFADMFLPDIFYIVTVLLDVGPIELRTAVHQLLLNFLQSFFSKKTISDGSKAVIRATVENFTSARSKLLFGLNRETADNFNIEVSKFATRISTMENLVASLLEITEVASVNIDEKTVWILRWNRHIIDATMRKDSVLRGRALLLLGILAKNGANDRMVTRMLELVADDAAANLYDPRYLYLAICSIFALSRIVEGLTTDSIYFCKLFWLALSISHADLLALYQGGLQFVTRALDSINIKYELKSGDLIDELFTEKQSVAEFVEQIESVGNVYSERFNLDLVLSHVAGRGLHLTQTKPTSITAFRKFFQIRYVNEIQRVEMVEGATFDQSPLIYLLFLFILLKPAELQSVLNDIDIIDEYIPLDEQTLLPRTLANFLLSDSDIARIGLIQCAIYFNAGDPQERTKLRFLQILRFIGERNPVTFQYVYSEIRPALRNLVGVQTLSSNFISEMFAVASLAYTTDGYEDGDIHLKANNDLLEKYRVSGIRDYALVDVNFAEPESDRPPLRRGIVITPLVRRLYESRLET